MARASGGQDVDQSRRIPLSAHSDGDGDTVHNFYLVIDESFF